MAAHDALRAILPVAGLQPERAASVEITGGTDPILPTPFRIGETSAAALAATGLAVSDLWELRTGRKQDVAVDLRQATAALRSGHYLKVDGATMSTERNAVRGVYPAKNGRWRYGHANCPNRRADLRPHVGRARRRRSQDHRTACTRARLPGRRHRAWQAVGQSRPAPAEGSRNPEGAGARGRRVQPGLPAGHAGRARPLAGGL